MKVIDLQKVAMNGISRWISQNLTNDKYFQIGAVQNYKDNTFLLLWILNRDYDSHGHRSYAQDVCWIYQQNVYWNVL